MFFKQKRFRKVPSAIVAIQNEFYIGIDSSKLSEKTLLDIGLTKVMCAEKTGGFNLVNYRHSSGVYHEQETEDLHRRI